MIGYTSSDPADFVGETVSLVQLIASLLRSSGKKVRLIGYVTFQFEGERTYLHKEDFDNGISLNAIWISIPDGISQSQRAELEQKYVICDGTFVALKHGHDDILQMALWSESPESKNGADGASEQIPPKPRFT
jgi:hypothetical protein